MPNILTRVKLMLNNLYIFFHIKQMILSQRFIYIDVFKFIERSPRTYYHIPSKILLKSRSESTFNHVIN